jgi:hypothetical protein
VAKKHVKRIGFALGSLSVLAAFLLLLFSAGSSSYSASSALDKDYSKVGTPTGGKDVVSLELAVTNVDPNSSAFGIIATPRLAGSYGSVLGNGSLVETPLQFVFDAYSGQGRWSNDVAEIAGGMDVALKLFGDVRDYPFDRYNSYLISTASDISTKNPAQTGLYMQDSKEVVPGFKVASELFSVSADDKASKKLIASTIEREQVIGITGVKWTIERSFDTVLTVLLMALLMILGATVSTLITIAIVRGKRPPSLNSLGWLAAFLFAMFSLRTQLPGNPPNGILFDLWVFYPVVLILVLLIAVTVTSWILREDWDMANPVVAIRGKRED